MSVRSFVTRYGTPGTRKLVEHDEDECAACKAVGGLPEGGIIFMVVERPDGEEEIRRIEGLGRLEPGLYVSPEYGSAVFSVEPVPFTNGCRRVTDAEVREEMARAFAEGRVPS